MKSQIKSLLILAIVLLGALLYSLFLPETSCGGLSLRQIGLSALQDTAAAPAADAAKEKMNRHEIDTTAQRFLFFGDSMLEGLSKRFSDYAAHNGHELHTVLWYSSSSEIWAKSDTLQHFLRKVQPTFVVVCLCSNELFVRDLDKRNEYLQTILAKIGSLPFVWISPPNWKEDTGINELIIKNVGTDRYFDSRHLELARGRDGAHPTFDAAASWMDSVAVWMSRPERPHPVKMELPTEHVPNRNLHLLMPPK